MLYCPACKGKHEEAAIVICPDELKAMKLQNSEMKTALENSRALIDANGLAIEMMGEKLAEQDRLIELMRKVVDSAIAWRGPNEECRQVGQELGRAVEVYLTQTENRICEAKYGPAEIPCRLPGGHEGRHEAGGISSRTTYSW